MTADSAKAQLTVVTDEVYRLDRKPETTAERVRRLQAEARLLAREEIDALEEAMKKLAAEAKAIAEGGEAYPVGVRELASRMAEDLEMKANTFQGLMDRIPDPTL